MIRVFLRSLAVLAFSAGLAGSPSYAQNAEQKGAEPGKGEAAKEGVRRSDDATAGRSVIGAAGRPECTWLGERAVKLMRNDDLDTAFRHLDLYDRFGCPGEHVRISFRCVVQWSQNPQKDAKEQKDQKDQKDQKAALDVNYLVEQCWKDPINPTLPLGPASASAATEKSGTK
jgi:hypothetical protein